MQKDNTMNFQLMNILNKAKHEMTRQHTDTIIRLQGSAGKTRIRLQNFLKSGSLRICKEKINSTRKQV